MVGVLFGISARRNFHAINPGQLTPVRRHGNFPFYCTHNVSLACPRYVRHSSVGLVLFGVLVLLYRRVFAHSIIPFAEDTTLVSSLQLALRTRI